MISSQHASGSKAPPAPQKEKQRAQPQAAAQAPNQLPRWRLKVTQRDVGQGDCAFIVLENLNAPEESVYVMLDGGFGYNDFQNRQFFQRHYPGKKLDVVIAGSTDLDHFTGLIQGPDVLVKPGAVYLGNKSKSPFRAANAGTYVWVQPTGAATENLWSSLGRPRPEGAPNFVYVAGSRKVAHRLGQLGSGENAWSLGFYLSHGRHFGFFTGGDLDGGIEAAIPFDRFRGVINPEDLASGSGLAAAGPSAAPRPVTRAAVASSSSAAAVRVPAVAAPAPEPARPSAGPVRRAPANTRLSGCKAGHHGSDNSNFAGFLQTNTPRFEIVSTNGTYNHPTPITLARFASLPSLKKVYVTNPLKGTRMSSSKAQFGSQLVIAGSDTRTGQRTVNRKRVMGDVTVSVSPEQAQGADFSDWSIEYQRAPGATWGGRDKRVRQVCDEYFEGVSTFADLKKRLATTNMPPPFLALIQSCQAKEELPAKAAGRYQPLAGAADLQVKLKPINVGSLSSGNAGLQGQVLSYKQLQPGTAVVKAKGRIFMYGDGVVVARSQTSYQP